ncbi:hypothetical protein BGS_0614 [Beggiatoa sp. SS]|nr:hypothetical protein BGS_0614 [Beggiatoa sp. SS]
MILTFILHKPGANKTLVKKASKSKTKTKESHMSLLMDALNKVDKMVETKQPYSNQTVDSSSSTYDYDEELFLAEITHNERPKKTFAASFKLFSPRAE